MLKSCDHSVVRQWKNPIGLLSREKGKPKFHIGLQNTLSLQLSIKSPASHSFFFDKDISKDISQIDYICLFLVLSMHFRVII